MEKVIMDTTNVELAVEEEKSLSPGAYDIRFYLAEPVGDNDLRAMREHLMSNGVNVIGVSQHKSDGLWYVSVRYRKPAATQAIGFLPVAIIPLIALGFVGALIGIGIFKIEDIMNNIGKILLITFGGLTLFALAARKPVEAAAKAYASRKY